MRRRGEGLISTGEPLPDSEQQTEDEEPEPSEDESLAIGQPIEALRLECGCDACVAELEFYRSGLDDFDHLVLTFRPETDHFAVDPAVLGALLGTLAR